MNDADRPVEMWIVNAGLRLSRMYQVDRYDCEQVVRCNIAKGRSRRISWLKARVEIERNYLQTPRQSTNECDALRQYKTENIEQVTRMMDMELILDKGELVIVNARLENRTEVEIGEMLGVDQSTVSRKLSEIRRKILAYYAS